MDRLDNLSTEAQNPLSASIDRMDTLGMLTVIHQADQEAVLAVTSVLPQIAEAVDRIAEKLRTGGHLFYTGAGTSGRLGVLDASECPPTFNVPAELVQGLIAGGDRALRHAVEGAEDNAEAGAADLRAKDFRAADVLVGIAASGRTPYVQGALSYAHQVGGLTIALACVSDSQIGKLAKLKLEAVTGPEVLTGSTRLKAGTATKLILNMLSTGVMIRLGMTYGNSMVNVQPTNHKLQVRAVGLVQRLAKVSETEAEELLSQGGSVKTAVVMKRKSISRHDAEALLAATNGVLRSALE